MKVARQVVGWGRSFSGTSGCLLTLAALEPRIVAEDVRDNCWQRRRFRRHHHYNYFQSPPPVLWEAECLAVVHSNQYAPINSVHFEK